VCLHLAGICTFEQDRVFALGILAVDLEIIKVQTTFGWCSKLEMT